MNKLELSPLLKEKAGLMISIRDKIKELGITQEEAANIIGCQQSRVSSLVIGEIDKFSLDWLFTADVKLKEV